MSGGRWGDVDDVGDLIDDALQFIEAAAAAQPGLPVFVRAQSLGGLVALAASVRRPELLRGMALGAPAVELPWLVRIFAPQVLLDGAARLREQVDSVVTPLAVFQGVEDSTVDAHGTCGLVERAGSPDKSLYLYKDMGHNMSIEPDVRAWLLSRLGGQTHAASVLHIRRPVAGVKWQPPPPGSTEAAANTYLETYIDEEEQRRVLDGVLTQPMGPLRVAWSYAAMLPLYFIRGR